MRRKNSIRDSEYEVRPHYGGVYEEGKSETGNIKRILVPQERSDELTRGYAFRLFERFTERIEASISDFFSDRGQGETAVAH